MGSEFGRRQFLGRMTTAAAIGTGALGFPLTGESAPGEGRAEPRETGEETEREVRLERLRPREIDGALARCPTLFQPLGTIEWHGVHNVVGVDAVKAHHLCVRAARSGGGLVAPPLYGGIGGLKQPHTFVIEPENGAQSLLLRSWLERLCFEAVRNGFRVIIILTGHYGAEQQMVVRETAVRMSRALAVPVLGTPEYFLAMDEGYLGDHAAWGETSLMLHLDPDTVAIDRLGEPPHRGVGGRDPREATREDGRRLTAAICGRLARLARRMPEWSQETLARFIDAESALVTRQIELAGAKKSAWEGWRNIGKGVFSGYGRLLAEEKFAEIVELVKKL